VQCGLGAVPDIALLIGATWNLRGTHGDLPRYLGSVQYQEEAVMPVLVMWAIPAVVVIGGVGYWLVHMH